MTLTRNQKLWLSIAGVLLGLPILILTFIFKDNLIEANPLNAGIVLVYLLFIVGAIFLLVGLWMLYAYLYDGELKLTTRHLTVIAIQSALSVLLYYFVKFPAAILNGRQNVYSHDYE